MRDATKEEQESINEYINSIAIDTGVNFFDIENFNFLFISTLNNNENDNTINDKER